MYACIFIPDFTVEAVLRAEPMLRGQALVVLEGTPPLCYVVGANEATRDFGIEIGMTKALVEAIGKPKNGTKCPSTPLRSSQEDNAQLDLAPRCMPQDERDLQTRKPITKKEERRTKNASTLPARMQHMRDGMWGGGMYRASAGEALIGQRKRTKNAQTKTDNLVVRQRSTAQELAAHSALLDAAHAVSPKVEDTAPDTVVLDIDGLERLFGTPAQVAQELSRRVNEVGLCGNVAVAANPDAAEHAARGFTGVTIIPAGREADRLGALPLKILFSAERNAFPRAAMRVDQQRKLADRLARMQETLDRWGVRNFRGLAALPPVSLSERLGSNGVRLQALASGAAARELVLSDPPLYFEETIELEYPVDVIEPLAFLLSRMLEGLCARLSARALSTNELRLLMKLEHRTGDDAAKSQEELEGEPIVERKISLPVPMNDAKLFLKLLQLELSATPPGAPVTQLWLITEPARPRLTQAGLFMPLAPEPEKLELTLARIDKLLGVRGRAGMAEIVDTHQPDAFKVGRFKPSDEVKTAARSGAKANNSATPAAPAAHCPHEDSALVLRRFRPALTAQVEMRDGSPVRLLCTELGTPGASHDNVVWVAGPWRSSGNWWEERSDHEPSYAAHAWEREEWDIALAITRGGRRERETEIGLFRIIREQEQWSIEGAYD